MQTIFLTIPVFCNLDVSFKGGFWLRWHTRLCSMRSRFKTLQNTTALDPRAVLSDLTILYIYYSRTSGLGNATYARLRSSGNNLSEKKRRLARVRGRWRDRGKVLHSELWQNRMYFWKIQVSSIIRACTHAALYGAARCNSSSFFLVYFLCFRLKVGFEHLIAILSWRLCELVVFYWLVWEKCWIMV